MSESSIARLSVVVAALIVGCADDSESTVRSDSRLLRDIETCRLESEPVAGATGWAIYCAVLAESKGDLPSLAPPRLDRHRAEFERLRPLVPQLIEMSRLPFGKSYDSAVCFSELAAACERVGDLEGAARHRANWRSSYLVRDGGESSRVHCGGLLESRTFVNLLVLAARDASERGDFGASCEYLIAARDLGEQWLQRVLTVERMIGVALVSIANSELRALLGERGTEIDAAARAQLHRAFAIEGSRSESLPLVADCDDETTARSISTVIASLDAECLATRLAVESVEYFHAHGRWPYEPAELPAWSSALRDLPAAAAAIAFRVNDDVPSFSVDHRILVRS